MKKPHAEPRSTRRQIEKNSASSAPPRDLSVSDELPVGWAIVRITDVTDQVPNVKPEDSPESEFGYVDISAIDNTKFTIGEIKCFRGKDAPSRARRPIQANDVLFSNVRTYLRNVALVDRQCAAQLCSTGFTVLRANPAIEPRFLFRYVLTTAFVDRVTPQQTGTHYPATSDRVVMSETIALPPLGEQRRIVAKLETLLGKVDACQRRLAKIPRLLKRFRQSVLAAACSGRLTADWRAKHSANSAPPREEKGSRGGAENAGELPELPETWSWVPLGSCCRCFRGRFSPRPRNDPKYFNGKHPFIQIGDFPPEGGFIEAHRQTLNEDGLAVSRKFPKGTVVIAIVGATIGNTGVLAYDMCVTDSIVGLETGNELGNRYVELFLRHKKHDIRQASYSSGGQPNINLATLNPYPFALPPLPEQHEIVRRVEQFFTLADRLEARTTKAQAYVDKLTPSLLAKAFRGELVPQDPNEEPASALLARIRGAARTPRAHGSAG